MATTQIFKLGGYSYKCPTVIGCGVRARYNENQLEMILKSEHADLFINLVKEVIGTKIPIDHRVQKNDNVIKAEREKTIREGYAKILQAFQMLGIYRTHLLILKTILTPCAGSPSVEEAFDISSEEEFSQVESFFTSKSTLKIQGGRTTTRDSKITKGNRKAKT